MASQIRNARVAAFKSTIAGTVTIYTVPVGFVLLLKSVVWRNWSGIDGQAYLQIITSDNVAVWVAIADFTANNENVIWSNWVPLNAGDQIQAFMPQANMQVIVGGAVLPLNPTL